MTTGRDELFRVLDVLDAAGCPGRVAGGWGVDLLVGRQTRAHRDLDLLVAADRLDAGLAALRGVGYEVETDQLPVRIELAAAGRGRVDLHPCTPDARGDLWQAGPDGTVFHYPAADLVAVGFGGRTVACVSAGLQRRVHAGYPPRDVDRHDLALLADLDDAERDQP